MRSFGEWMNDMSESILDASTVKDKQEEVLFNPFMEIETQSYDDDLATYMCGMLSIMPVSCICRNSYDVMQGQFMRMDELERSVYVHYFSRLLS